MRPPGHRFPATRGDVPSAGALLALDGLRVLVALRLGVPAAVLLFSPAAGAEFRQTGLPDWWRAALALPELAGAILFAVRSTASAGAGLLVLDLIAAIGLHWYLGRGPGALYLLLPLVAFTGVLQRRLGQRHRHD